MKKIICLMLIFLVIGQLSETKEQTIKYGEYIDQYAIIQNITASGAIVYNLCSDCTGYITIKDSSYKTIIDFKTATEIDKGHFGYVAKSQYLGVGKIYNVQYNFTSNYLGSWIVDSKITITNKTDSISVNSLSNIIPDIKFPSAKEFVSEFISSIIDLTGSVGQGFINFLVAIGSFIDIIIRLLKDYLYPLALQLPNFLNDPSKFTSETIIPYIIGLFISFISVNFLLFMFIETLILALTCFMNVNNPLHIFIDFIHVNGKLFMFLYDIFIKIITVFIDIISKLIIGFVNMIKPTGG